MRKREILTYLSLIFVAGMAFGQLCRVENATFEKFAQFGSGISGFAAILAVVAAFMAIDRWKHEHEYKTTFEKIDLAEQALKSLREAAVKYFVAKQHYCRALNPNYTTTQKTESIENEQMARENYLLKLSDYNYRMLAVNKQTNVKEDKSLLAEPISISLGQIHSQLEVYYSNPKSKISLNALHDGLIEPFNNIEIKLDNIKARLKKL